MAAQRIMVPRDGAARNLLDLAQVSYFTVRKDRPTGAKGLAFPSELESGRQKLLVLQLLSKSLSFQAAQPITEFASSSVYSSTTGNLQCGKSL